jgi:sirohydrochlorin ferrochelatase
MTNSDFFDVWRQFQGKDIEDTKPRCPIAAEFLKKIEEWLFAPLENGATRQQVAQAKYLLQEEYQSWKKSIPAKHVRTSSDHHQCLSEVYDRCYDRLHLMELTLRPPLHFLMEQEPAPKPTILPTPPTPQIAGIFLGETEE